MSTRNIVFVIIAVIIAGVVLWSNTLSRQGKIIVDENNRAQTESIVPSVAITASQPATVAPPVIKNIKSMTKGIITTNKGIITVELFADKAPKTVENFKKLANSGFYDSTRFHRVIKGFMIQGGDPLSKDLENQNMWGTGGPGYAFADEIYPANSNAIGTIAMANAGPNTNGSQFFINVTDNSSLDRKHTVFGRVMTGMDVVIAIENTKTVPGDRPLEDMMIQKIEVK
jgi:cyclophilin family peptidyl-prolyl cis-trans isomerase